MMTMKLLMNHVLQFALLLFFLTFVPKCLGFKNDFAKCKTAVMDWKASALELSLNEDKHTLRDLLFFLHIPRTGGRTYFHCLLKKLYPNSMECPRSYDKLRFDPSKTNCRLLVTHDDYSVMSKLPREKTSVVTILRNPVDRVFSSYEFSIEVAARFLVHPNITSATKMDVRLRAKTKGVSTLDIWPWKYLVPWMREDLFSRRDARNKEGQKSVYRNDSYNMEDTVMPLHVYINDPIAHDIVHNGATFQVAGLTNNSYVAGSHLVRHCVQTFRDLGIHVLEVAKNRLDDMLYVGLTDEHRESATMFGNVVGAQVISQLKPPSPPSNLLLTANKKSGHTSAFPDSDPDIYHLNNSINQKTDEVLVAASAENSDGFTGNMTVATLMEAYGGCIKRLRSSQTRRRTTSLLRISPAKFSTEARQRVPQAVLQQIESLNNLDMELYKHARKIFAEQHKHVAKKLAISEMQESVLFSYPYDISFWKIPLVVSSSFMVLVILVYVNARRRTSKLKI